MKRILMSMILFCSIALLHAQTEKFSRWSVTAAIGPCVFDGDVSQSRMQLYPTSFQEVAYGITAEYGLASAWGISLDYFHLPLSGENTNISFYTPLNVIDLSGSVNILKIIYPYQPLKWGIFGNLGIGYAFYTSNFRYPDPVNSTLESLPGVAISIPVSFDLEYNLSKSLALGGKIAYRSLNKDNVEGATAYNFKGVTNDFIGAMFLYVRYKINEKDKTHIRNTTDDKLNGFILATASSPKTTKTESPAESKTDSLANQFATILKAQNAKLDSMAKIISDLSTEVAKNKPQKKEKEVELDETENSTPEITDNIPSVYFDFNKSVLNQDALITITKVAAFMNNNPKINVEIKGYCDYLGGISYNSTLSKKRAVEVKKELIKTWKISSERITVNGKGRLEKPATEYRLNRRCDFIFYK